MSRGERKGSETTKENSENEPLEIAETIEYFEEDEKTFQKPLDKYIKIWYNNSTKEREDLLMGAIYQVKNNNKGIEYYSNLAVAKTHARQYLAERVMQREPTAYNIAYNEKISYVGGCVVVVLTATMRENRYGVRKTYRQNIKCPRVNEYWTCADGTQDFYNHIKAIQKREGK